MPPPPGSYIIFNPAASTFIGLADDAKTVVGYSTITQMMRWEVGSDNRIAIALKSGETRYLTMVEDRSGADVIVNQSGWLWDYAPMGEDMWKMAYSIGCPTWCVTATSLGRTPQNAKVTYEQKAYPGAPASWRFIPFTDLQRLVANPVFAPVDVFSISSETLQKIVIDMLAIFKEDLKVENPPSMIPTHVTRIPNGSEEGSFLALTVANKLTVSYFKLKNRKATRHDADFDLPSQLLGGPANELFVHIAQSVKEAVVGEWHLSSTQEKPLLMGMTFAFPVAKKSLRSATLLRWTKEITDTSNVSSAGTVRKDVVELLQAALKKIDGLHIECNALINDATATLLAQAYESRGCEIGAIFDRGTNGAYVEAAENVESLRSKDIGGQMVLNTEWGSFGNTANLQRTQFDYQIDRESTHPGQQIFEKLISSTSVGELVRLVLLYHIDTLPLLARNRPLFNRISSKKLNAKGGIDLELVWDIDDADDNSAVQQLLVDRLGLSPNNVTEEDGNTVKEICRAILRRAARLGACAIASVLVLMGRAQVGGGIEKGGRVGINGNLTSAAFRRDMEEALGEIIGVNAARKVLIARVNEDRIDLGAAVCACLASASG